jgi:predicted glycoside hydrolase/deacetylase ChbG (UPF0249 family)
MSPRLIINGDDFGLTDGVSAAILTGLDEGWLSSTSAMVRAAGAESRIRAAAQKLKVYAGVHLQLTTRRTHASRIAFPVEHGEHAVEKLSPHQVETEWEAQIEFARELGLAPTHIDTHHNAHLELGPSILDVYLTLAQRYQLPVRGDSGWVADRMRKLSVRGSTYLIRNWTGTGGNVEALLRELNLALARCGENDVIEIVSHPAYVDNDLRHLSSLNDARAADIVGLRRLLASGELAKRGIELRSFLTAFNP